MDGLDRPDDDIGIDREIAAALDVNPSPEFVARVRTRISGERRPSALSALSALSGPWRSWRLAIAGALAVAVTVAVALSRPKEVALPEEEVALLEHVEAPVAAEGALPAPPPAPGARRADATRRDPHGASAQKPTGGPTAEEREMVASAEPEAFIDVREARAIRAFIDRARNGPMELEPFFSAPPQQVTEALPLQDIYIARIEFEPLTADNSEQGVSQ